MADTQAQLANKLKAAFNAQSDVDVNPQDSRNALAEDMAAAFFDAMIGRQTTVTGIASGGATVTGTGIIQG